MRHHESILNRLRGLWIASVLLAHPTPAGAGSGTQTFGFHPLSFVHSVVWFGIEEHASTKNLDCIVFMAGSPGWQRTGHEGLQLGVHNPGLSFWVVGMTDSVLYDPVAARIGLGQSSMSIASDNVFLIEEIDGREPVLRSLGQYELTFPAEVNPAEELPRRFPAIRSALTGKPVLEPTTAYSAEALKWEIDGTSSLANEPSGTDPHAAEALKRAAEAGIARAQYNLGFCYQHGRGVQQDDIEANYWYLKAANQGYVDAQFKLGYAFEVGRGCDANATESFRWYEIAALSDDVQSQYRVACRLRDGTGASADLASSYGWFLVLLHRKREFVENEQITIEQEVAALEMRLSNDQKLQGKSLQVQRLGELAVRQIERLAQ